MEALGWNCFLIKDYDFFLEAKALSLLPGEYEGNFETQTSRRP